MLFVGGHTIIVENAWKFILNIGFWFENREEWIVDKKKRRIVRVVALVLGVALLALGFLRGESDVILQKAIFVCYECIGIG